MGTKTFTCAGCGMDTTTDGGATRHPEYGWMCESCAACADMFEGGVVTRLVELLERASTVIKSGQGPLPVEAEELAFDIRAELAVRHRALMRDYIVVGINANNESDRYADTYEGFTPQDAEEAAREHYRTMNGDDLIVAAVIDAETHQIVG